MTQQHLIAPSPGLVQQWCDIALAASGMFEGIMQFATLAAQWGADQELEACCALMDDWGLDGEDLMECRRPKPPSLKEQAQDSLQIIMKGYYGDPAHADLIRRALEQLPQ